MTANKHSAFSQVTLLIIALCILATIAAIPVIPSVRSLVYTVMYNYYKAPPRWSIVRLFDNYADNFDLHLTKTLEYNTPSDLTAFVHSSTTLNNPIKKVLDLGCGTGLLGQALTKQYNIEQLIGIDISSKMLQKAETKAIYHELHNADILEYLQNSNEFYDLITATDVFIYVGDLRAISTQVHKRLKPGGYFAFSVESLPVGTVELMPSGRFQHSLHYLQTVSADSGFKNIRWKSVALRKDHDLMIPGYLILMKK